MKKAFALLLVLAMLLCASAAFAEEPLTIGFCNYTDTDQFFITVKDSMNRVCEEKGYTLLYAVSEADPTKMRSLSGSSDDDLYAALMGVRRPIVHFGGLAMCARNLHLVWNTELVELSHACFHGRHV